MFAHCLAWSRAGGAAGCIGRSSYPTRAPYAWQGAPAQSQAHEEEDKERWSSQTCKWASVSGLPIAMWPEGRVLGTFNHCSLALVRLKTRH